MTNEQEYPDVDVLTGVADGLKNNLSEYGYDDIFDIAIAKSYSLEQVHGLGTEKAESLISEAEEIIDEEYFTNRRWDPVTEEYVDAEPDIFHCEYCGQSFPQRAIWKVHQSNCSERVEDE